MRACSEYGMLAVDRFELLAGLLEAALLEIGETLIVELVGGLGLLDIRREIDVVVRRTGRQKRRDAGAKRNSGCAHEYNVHHSACKIHAEIRPFGAFFLLFRGRHISQPPIHSNASVSQWANLWR